MSVFIKSVIQELNNSQTQVAIEHLEITLILIFISVAILILMTTPIVLFYAAFENYFKWKVLKKQITNELCCNNNSHPSYVSEVCDQYEKSFLNFLSNFIGLISWNLFSILYISIAFSSFKTGVTSYFLFPFKVIESYTENYATAVLYGFKTQGIYMFFIFIASVLFFQIGNYIARFLLKNNGSFNLKDKIVKKLKISVPKTELNDSTI